MKFSALNRSVTIDLFSGGVVRRGKLFLKYRRNLDDDLQNVSPAMKRATICVIVVITLVFLLLNIYGLMEIWKFYKEAKKRPPSLETIVKQQQGTILYNFSISFLEEATKRAEERMKEMEDGILKHFDTTTHLLPKWTTTYPTITRQYPTPDWATHSRTRSRISSYVFPVTTSSTTKIVPSTTVATRTIAASTTTTTELPTTTSHTTRIIVTRPPPVSLIANSAYQFIIFLLR